MTKPLPFRTRVLTEAGELKEADKPSERLPKSRRFMLVDASPDLPTSATTGVVAEGICWTDGGVALRFRGEQRATVLYDRIEDVIAANAAELSWVD